MAKKKDTVGRKPREREERYKLSAPSQAMKVEGKEEAEESRAVIPAVEMARDKQTVKELAPEANKGIAQPPRPGVEGDVSKAYGADPIISMP